MINDKPEVKFELIQNMLYDEDNLLDVQTLCNLAGVSKSGYYRYLSSSDKRAERELQDKEDFELILTAYNHRGYSKGARSIYMQLIHHDPPVIMNIKKIRRLMDKFGLFCPIRKANPYRRMAKALRTSNVAPNLLNREFTTHGPRKVLLTDITYIPFNGVFFYLSTVIDAYTRQVLSYVFSQSLEIDFVLKTIENLVENHGISLQTETIINSDQGSHYTSYKFIQILKDNDIRQSMSRRGNCWDNAPQESFFGHMKDEINLQGCFNFIDVKTVIDDWMNYYNNQRYQWQLSKLSPNEYYQYCISGKYPLNVQLSSSNNKM